MKVLAQFKITSDHLDFCIPELKALIQMHNLDWREVFKHEFTTKEEEHPVVLDSPYYSYMYYKGQLNKKMKLPDNPADIRHSSFLRFPFMFLELPNLEISRSII